MSGSTVLGGYDDHNSIADVCKKYGLWHHIDACWGGYLAFSEIWKKRLLSGAERSSSIAINAHKGLGMPL